MHYTYWIVVVFVRVCLYVCVWSYAWYIQSFSPPYCSSLNLNFIEKLTRDTMKCEIHVEITISQTHSNSRTHHKSITMPFGMASYLQGKYEHCNTYRFVRQFKRFLSYSFFWGILSYSRMVGPNGVPARPWLVLILKKNRAHVLLLACVVRTLANPNQSSLRISSRNIWRLEF